MPEVIALRYRGDGAFRPSLPARDLDAADIAASAAVQNRSLEEFLAEAVGCGLYDVTYADAPVDTQADDQEEPVGEPVDAQADAIHPDDMTKAQLVETAAALGVDINPRATNATIRESLATAAETEPVAEVPSA